MRVCFLTHYFPPEVGAPQARIGLLARSLATAGIEVTVHTGFPNYPDGRIAPPYRNRPLLIEERDGVRIVRSAVYPTPNRGFARRLLNHLSLAGSALATLPASGPTDVVVAETPPLFTAAAGVAYARAKRAALIVNVADRWPASAVDLGMLTDRRAIALAEALERWVYRHAELVTAPTEGLVEDLDRVPEAHGRCRRTWPVIDIDRFAPREEPAPEEPRPLRVLYAGTVGLAHGLDTLVRAAGRLGPDHVEVRIAGGGADAERVAALARAEDLPNVAFLGTLAAAKIPGLYGWADAAVVLLRDVPIFAGALPTKLFEAMAAGVPVVLSARGESARAVTDASAGLVCAPEDPRALADALGQLAADPGLRHRLGSAGRVYAETRFGAARAVAQWRERLEEAHAHRLTGRRPTFSS